RQRLEREHAAFAWRPAGQGGARGGCAFLGDGVPLAARIALALPATVGGAAVLADEAQFATGHDPIPAVAAPIDARDSRRCGSSAPGAVASWFPAAPHRSC